MLACWPGRIPAGTERPHVSAFWDFLPTACEVAGVDAPAGTDGISFLASLLGRGFEQKDIRMHGHAIECRINAEDPSRDFSPSPGKITEYFPPGGPGIRVDSHVYAGYEIPVYYDSMIAKVITVGRMRETAIMRMQRALDEYIIGGVKTTLPFHRKVLADPRFRKGRYTTSFVEEFFRK